MDNKYSTEQPKLKYIFDYSPDDAKYIEKILSDIIVSHMIKYFKDQDNQEKGK